MEHFDLNYWISPLSQYANPSSNTPSVSSVFLSKLISFDYFVSD